MVFGVVILVVSVFGSLQSWHFVENPQSHLLDSWGISRVKREQTIKDIKEKFPETQAVVCEMMHYADETPFIALVLFRTSGRFLCMGTIIDKKHILSAKRCYERSEVGDLYVLVGYRKAYWGRHSQVLKVRKILRHEYEVAILRLHKKIEYHDYVQAVRLPSAITKTEKEMEKAFPPPYMIAGMNVDRFDVPGDYIEKDKLYEVREDKIVKFDECKKNYSKMVLEPPKLFCTMGNATFCWGAWGGPVLKWAYKSYYLQVGVVVSDNCTAETTGPLLAIRTDAYADWIFGNSFQGRQPS